MDTVLRDLRHALRGLWHSPGFAASAILSIGLGIGANTTVFAWIDNIVRHPFPAIPDGGTLVALNVADHQGRLDGMPPIALPTLDEWRRGASTLAATTAHAQARMNLRAAPSAVGEPVWVELVDAVFFDVLRVPMAAGRSFTPQDDRDAASVMVVSHATWQRRFGGDPGLLGRSLIVNGLPLTVIGIAPAHFDGVVMGLAFDAWIPLWQQPALLPGSDWRRDRSARRVQAVARLRDGVSIEQARQELSSVALAASRTAGESPLTGAGVRWVSDTQLGSLMGPLSLAMVAITAVVLAAACANVAGLLLARAVARQRQTAIQVALGASRARLVQQALVQGACLAGLGCLVGLAVALSTKGALTTFVPRVALPVHLEIDVNWRVTAFAAGASAAAALVFALVPALRASKPDVIHVLRATAAGSGGAGRSRWRQALVIGQVAVSLVALSTADVFLRSGLAASAAPLGFGDPRAVLLVATDLSFTRLEGEPRAQVVERALESVRALPGVVHAAATTLVPLSFGGPPGLNTRVDGYTPAPNDAMLIGRVAVTDGYFETMDIPLAEGRLFSASDRMRTEPVAIVNQAFVRRFRPSQSGLGLRVDQGDGWSRVVGVVQDSVVTSLTESPPALIYRPFGQVMPDGLVWHVRSGADPRLLVEPVRRALASAHPDLPALDPLLLSEAMTSGTFVQGVGSAVFAVFGVVAVLIAATGLFGVMAGYVAERRRELAIAVALGASPRRVIATVTAPALNLLVVGLVIGGGLAMATAAVLANRITGARLDLLTLASGIALLVLVALGTSVWPAWRAVRIDPLAALRSQ